MGNLHEDQYTFMIYNIIYDVIRYDMMIYIFNCNLV
jgi:hypothetical protein